MKLQKKRSPRLVIRESDMDTGDHAKRRSPGRRTTNANAGRWRRIERPRILRAIAARATTLTWTPALLHVILEELYAEDTLLDLIGDLTTLPRSRYPQAIALAVVIRHSWRPDDLRHVVRRLGIRNLRWND